MCWVFSIPIYIYIYTPFDSRVNNQQHVYNILNHAPSDTYYGSRGRLICLLWSSDLLFWVLATASTYNLVLIGVERYLAVVHPIYHRRIVNKRSVCIAAVVVIATAVLASYWSNAGRGG